MKMATLAEAGRELNMQAITIRRRANRGMYPYLMIGTKMLVDIDILKPMVEEERRLKSGINITDLSNITGLTVSAIRRGIREGWIPFWQENRRSRFKLEEVQAAIIKQMQGLVPEKASQDKEPETETNE